MRSLSQFLIGITLLVFLSSFVLGNPINDVSRPLLVSVRKGTNDTNSTLEDNEDFNSTARPVILIEDEEIAFAIPDESNFTDYNSEKSPQKVEGFKSTSHSPASLIGRERRSLVEEEDKSDKSGSSENSSKSGESKEDINSTVIPVIFIEQEGIAFIVPNDGNYTSENRSENAEGYNKGTESSTSTSTSTSSAGLLAREQRSLGEEKHKSDSSEESDSSENSSESAESKEVVSSKLNSSSASNVRQKRSFGGRKFIPMVFG
ncbi:lisH domain-containing protein C1711.05-like [Sitophilus oryzae]|uniref:LisH domain-containing protein C1711.05-like n=1 Tax=Sitophilus oryzae TaxID=7048 RepID=A0A6J2YFP5_SITOR|nr:lisH domain-containing protein C1711.05-like [Sitophilus oryzae]